MPLFDTQCSDCAHTEEHLVPRRSDPAPVCSQCGSTNNKWVWLRTPVMRGKPYSPYDHIDDPKTYRDPPIVVGPHTQKKRRT